MSTSRWAHGAPQDLRMQASWWLNRPLVRPAKVIFLLTHRCPLRCEFCSTHRWAEARPGELTLAQLEERLREAVDWGIREFLFSGGEPLVRRSDVLALTRLARSLGAMPTLITSGSVGGRPEQIAELADAGMGSFMLSLDGPDAATHDRVRHRAGSFDEVTAWLTEATRLRDRAIEETGERPFTVYAQTVILRENVHALTAIADRVREIGVDGLLVQALAPDDYAREHAFGDAELDALRAQLPGLVERAGDGLLMNSPSYLAALEPFYAGRQDPAGRRCLAGYDVMVLAPDGSVSSCRESFTRDILGPGGEPLPLRKVWAHERFRAARRTMRVCKDPCMINCWYVE